MWPFSSRRSSTFSMSKLGYFASRAPSAIFSKSRNTAIVASVALADMHYPLEPVVIEAYADPLGIGAVGRNLVAKPTLEQDQLSGRSRKRDPGAGMGACTGLARWGSHKSIQTRILEFRAG